MNEELEKLKEKGFDLFPVYSAEVIEKIDKKEGFGRLKVGVFKVDKDGKKEQVGEYERNYSSLFNTFYHFRKNEKDYALYSRDYTSTRVMELPSCNDIGGEERDGCGFCPVDLYVPWFDERDKFSLYPANFGFVAGCVWGDDSSWKIQYLDLTEVEQGIISRDDRFGYIEMPGNLSLKQAISLWYYSPGSDLHNIEIAVAKIFSLDKNKYIDGYESKAEEIVKEFVEKNKIRCKESISHHHV